LTKLTLTKIMKKILTITALIAVFFISVLSAGNKPEINKRKLVITGSDTVTKSFAVSGNGVCKSTIESIVTSNSGVLNASWDSTAKIITVTYVHSIIKKSQLCRALANAGYDNTLARTKDATYANLPAACQYTRTAPTQ
jgi:hypothetical protein